LCRIPRGYSRLKSPTIMKLELPNYPEKVYMEGAEMIAGASGMGYYLVSMQYAMRPGEMYGAIVLLAAFGYTLNWLFLAAERALLPWYHVRAA